MCVCVCVLVCACACWLPVEHIWLMLAFALICLCTSAFIRSQSGTHSFDNWSTTHIGVVLSLGPYIIHTPSSNEVQVHGKPNIAQSGKICFYICIQNIYICMYIL